MLAATKSRIDWEPEDPGTIQIIESGHRVVPEAIDVSASVGGGCPSTDIKRAGPAWVLIDCDVDAHLPDGDAAPDVRVRLGVDIIGDRAVPWIQDCRRIDGERRDATLPPEVVKTCKIAALRIQGAKLVQEGVR